MKYALPKRTIADVRNLFFQVWCVEGLRQVEALPLYKIFQLRFSYFSDFTCMSGTMSYAGGTLMSDNTEEEKCEIRHYSVPHQCYQLSLEMTMRASGVVGTTLYLTI